MNTHFTEPLFYQELHLYSDGDDHFHQKDIRSMKNCIWKTGHRIMEEKLNNGMKKMCILV